MSRYEQDPYQSWGSYDSVAHTNEAQETQPNLAGTSYRGDYQFAASEAVPVGGNVTANRQSALDLPQTGQNAAAEYAGVQRAAQARAAAEYAAMQRSVQPLVKQPFVIPWTAYAFVAGIVILVGGIVLSQAAINKQPERDQ